MKDTEHLYSGIGTHLMDEEKIDQFYKGEKVFLDKEEIMLYPNQFLMLVSNSIEKKNSSCKIL